MRPRALARGAGVVVLVALAWLCVLSAFDRAGQGLFPAFGTSWPRAAAARALQEGDAAAAMHAAAVVIRRDPVGRPSASLLGTAMLQSGDAAAGNAALAVATATGWRDEAAQIWAVQASLATADPVNAAAHLDALGRTDPALAVPSGWWSALEATAAGRDALGRRLALNPPWASSWVVASAAVSATGIAPRLLTLSLARRYGLTVHPSIATGATWEMVKRHPTRAATLWRLLRGEGDTAGAGVWDRHFTRTDLAIADSSPFGWYRPDGAGGQVSAGEEAGRPVLRVEEVGVTVAELLRTATALTPGRWRASWRQGGDGLALRLAPSCFAGGEVQPLGAGSADGRSYQDFSVGPGCVLQTLSLVAGGPDATAREGWIADLKIERR